MLKFRWRTILLVGLAFLLLPFDPRIARADHLPESAYISGFSGHAQTYSLSCEARSAVDWAAFWGVSISESEFLAGLPSSDNPDLGFVGDPSGVWGNIPPDAYGVHARPVASLLSRYGLQARAKRGLQWDDLRAEIAAGRPVIVWIIGQMWAGTPVAYPAARGKKTIVARYEHTMALIGYEASVVHVVDAYTGWNQTYSLDTFLTSWEVLGNMAVIGQGENKPPKRSRKKAPTPPAPDLRGGYTIMLPLVTGPAAGSRLAKAPSAERPFPEEADPGPQDEPPETYTVQHGDYLIALAEGFGLDWRDLAALNGIEYPYFIYPGQVLKIR